MCAKVLFTRSYAPFKAQLKCTFMNTILIPQASF